MQAWNEAHWEWENRGLGGFKAWCRNEAADAAQRLLSDQVAKTITVI